LATEVRSERASVAVLRSRHSRVERAVP